jgi:hypothetical protein
MTTTLDLLSLLGAGVSGVAALVSMYHLFARWRAERMLVDLLKENRSWQALLANQGLGGLDTEKLTEEQRSLLLRTLQECLDRLTEAQRALLYEGLRQDSAKGRLAYLAKLAMESFRGQVPAAAHS